MNSARHVIYEGRVQGVGFRWTVKSLAKGFDVTGTVTNLADGTVELTASGDADEVEEFLAAIRESALAGNIQREHIREIPPVKGQRGFHIAG